LTLEPRRIRLLMHLRQAGVGDHRVLGAIERVAREDFVPEAFRDRAWEDTALPIGFGQTVSQPLVVARMLTALAVGDRHKVLEIGTGSGYQTVALARLCRRVYTIERHHGLLAAAEAQFERGRVHNVTTRLADGLRGWPEQAPFERIVVSAAHRGPAPSPALAEQLAPGGVLVIPMADPSAGQARSQRIVRFTRTGSGLDREDLWPVRFVPLLPDVPEGPDGPPPRRF